MRNGVLRACTLVTPASAQARTGAIASSTSPETTLSVTTRSRPLPVVPPAPYWKSMVIAPPDATASSSRNPSIAAWLGRSLSSGSSIRRCAGSIGASGGRAGRRRGRGGLPSRSGPRAGRRGAGSASRGKDDGDIVRLECRLLGPWISIGRSPRVEGVADPASPVTPTRASWTLPVSSSAVLAPAPSRCVLRLWLARSPPRHGSGQCADSRRPGPASRPASRPPACRSSAWASRSRRSRPRGSDRR